MSVESYFLGEKIQCYIGCIYGIITVVLGAYLMFGIRTPLSKGISYPMMVLSALLVAICIAIILRTPRDLERVNGYVEKGSEKIESSEIPRMKKVISGFQTIKIVELVLIAIGILLITFFFKGSEMWKGIGIGLTIQGLVLYLFDHVAEMRAGKYLSYLLDL